MRVSPREFALWAAYDRISPFGDERADLRAGIVADAIVKSHIPKAKTSPADFMPKFERVHRQQSAAEMKAILGMAAAAWQRKR
jgi:hypothetical protein